MYTTLVWIKLQNKYPGKNHEINKFINEKIKKNKYVYQIKI